MTHRQKSHECGSEMRKAKMITGSAALPSTTDSLLAWLVSLHILKVGCIGESEHLQSRVSLP